MAAEPGEGLQEFLAQARGTGSTGEVAGAIEPSVTGTDDFNEDDVFEAFSESAAEEREELDARKDADADEELYEEKPGGEAARLEEEAARPAPDILPPSSGILPG